MKRLTVGAALVGVLALVGCDSMSEPEQACHDVIEWAGNTAFRCSGSEADRQFVVEELYKQMQCGDVLKLRDRSSLYGCCRVWYMQRDCAGLGKEVVPACCVGQLLY